MAHRPSVSLRALGIVGAWCCCISGWGAPTGDDAPPPFARVCFDDFDTARDGCPTRDEILSLLDPVRGYRAEVSGAQHQNKPIQRISGLFRLKTPWRADTVLRLALSQEKQFRIHLWYGARGVTLAYQPAQHRAWSAYGTTRRGNRPKPEAMALWALDNGRYYRSGYGTFEVRHHDGQVVLSRGDLVLLRAPLDGSPREVYFEGEARVCGIAVARSGPPPAGNEGQPPARTLVRRIDKPAELPWQVVLDRQTGGPALARLGDGSVELSAGPETKEGRAYVDLAPPGFHEIIFELADPEPGTGVFLGNEFGEPVAKVAFFRADNLGMTTFEDIAPDGNAWGKQYNVDYHIIPKAGARQWLKLVALAGSMRYFTSGDGVHWSEPDSSARAVRGPCLTAGLFTTVTSDPKRRALKLRSLTVRRFELLSSLVPEAALWRVGPLEVAGSYAEWEARVAESRPPDVPEGPWRHACCVHALVRNTGYGDQILDGLLDDVLAEGRPLPWKLGLLEEAGQLVGFLNYGTDGNLGQQFAEHYLELGRQMVRARHPAPFSIVSGAMLRSPGWNIKTTPYPQDLLRYELLTLAQKADWDRLGAVCRRLRHFTRIDELGWSTTPWTQDGPETVHLVRWATAQAAVRGRGTAAEPVSADTAPWRDPLEEQVDKAGFNVLGEFRSAVEAGAYQAACRVVSDSTAECWEGVLPDIHDDRLVVSLDVAMRRAMDRWPALRRAMQERGGPLGALRFEKAAAAGDAVAARAVSVQCFGTPAAGEAYLWLGDRALSQGRFGQAMAEYRHAAYPATDEQRGAVEARLRLAGAMVGEDLGRPPRDWVTLGTQRLHPSQFEQIVGRAREAHRSMQVVPPPSTAEAGHVVLGIPLGPAPGKYRLRPTARIDTSWEKAPSGLPSALFKKGVDVGARRLSVQIVGNRLLVSTQQQQALFDPVSGTAVWAQRYAPDKCSGQWSLGAMEPVIVGQQVLHRRLGPAGGEMVCRSAADGKEVWLADSASAVASDPLPVGPDVFALTVTRDLGKQLVLRLARFDAASGERAESWVLARFRDCWDGAVPCRAVLADHLIVATVGGTVVCCDLAGRVQWIRRQIFVTPPESLSHRIDWLRQAHNPPLVVGGRVYAAQPGVWGIECLDLDTGALRWRAPLPDLVCLAGQLDDRLIAETTGGLVALDPESGKVLWQCEVPERLDFRVCGGPEGLCCAAAERVEPNQPRRPVLVWIDPAEGSTVAETTLDLPGTQYPLVGPVAVVAGRAWLFTATGENEQSRAVCELVAE